MSVAHRITIAGLCLTLAASVAGAQTDRPAFELASVKPHKEGPARLPAFSNDRFTFSGPVQALISAAYQLPLVAGSPRLSGGPDWIRSQQGFYDIEAKASFPGGLSSSAGDERGRLMLQSLLMLHI